MQWLWMFPANIFCSLLCYLTNWIVVLFADNRGELHGVWRYWQTRDDSLDVDWFVKETVPEILRYDFDKHYVSTREQTEELKRYNRDKGCVICIDDNFGYIERIQRYFCRVLWLTRNCGYGFAFYLFGADHIGSHLYKASTDWYELWYSNDFIGTPWQLNAQIWRFQIMAGWKLHHSSTITTRSMIAGRIIFR